MKPSLKITSVIFCLTAMATCSAYAEENSSFPAIIGEDFEYVATAPARWENQEWQNLGWATLAVVGTASIADRPVRDFMCKQSREVSCDAANTPVKNSFLTTIENFGQTYALGVMGGFYLAGVMNDSEKSIQVSQDLVAATLVSATINQTIKVSVNRYRPRDNQGIFKAQGYTGLNNNSSFPSGHTTEAFTLASVIASHYEEEAWVGYTVYSVAGLVGVARMYHNAHFASDVTASALIGTFVGKSIVHHNHSLRGDKVALLPLLDSGFTGIQIVSRF